HAGITTGAGGDVTYQVAVEFGDSPGEPGGWSTLRSTGLATGAHSFNLGDMWVSSKAIGTTIAANTQYPLGDILDAMVGEGNSVAIGFGVQASTDALVIDITWGNDRYYFDGELEAATPTITGDAFVGSTLTATTNTGDWVPADGVTFTYQWNADG